MKVSAAELGNLLNVSDRRIHQLVAERVIPEPTKGKFDLEASVKAYVASLQKRLVGRAPNQEVGKTKLRELAAEARIKEARAAELEGRYLDREAMRATLAEVAVRLASSLDGAAGRMTGEIFALCGGDRSKIQAMLLAEHRRIRERMADALEALCKQRSKAA